MLYTYAKFDNVKNGLDGGFENLQSFWLFLGLVHAFGFFAIFIKGFLLEIIILESGSKIHEDMVMGVVRSPLTYFDITPSGQITNKFSNDLGILDNDVAANFFLVFERGILWVIMLGSLLALDLMYFGPAIACFLFFILFFNYAKNSIISAKQLSLKLKSPTFTQLR